MLAGQLRGEFGNLGGEFHSQLRADLVASVVGVAAGLAGLF